MNEMLRAQWMADLEKLLEEECVDPRNLHRVADALAAGRCRVIGKSVGLLRGIGDGGVIPKRVA
jgi:hypothetical protein